MGEERVERSPLVPRRSRSPRPPWPHRRPRHAGAARRVPALLVPVVAVVAVLAVGVGLGWRLGSSTEHRAPTASAGAGVAAPADLSVDGERAGAGGAGPAVSSAEPVSSAPSALPPRARALQALLDARASALLARDRRRWLAPLAGTGTASAASFRTAQATVFERLAAVPLSTWRWRYLGPGPALTAARARALPAGSWVAHVALEWGLSGAGSAPVRRDQDLTVVPTGRPRSGAGGGAPAAWALAGDGDGATQVDLWDLGPVSVARSARAVVLGTAPRAFLAAQAPLVDAAARTVDATWGTAWPRVSVVEAPATTAQLAALLSPTGARGASTAGLDQLAAVTTGELTGASGATTGDHVVLDPAGYGQLAPLGQQVVLTHELTHVATRAGAVRAAPRWLSEGFADWIGYSRSGLSREQVAGDLLAGVRTAGAPADLPADAAFDPASTDVGPAYSGAWLAVQVLAARCGSAGAVAVYRETTQATGPALPTTAGGASAFAAALRTTCGLDRAALVAAWRARLTALAGTGASAGAR